MIAKCECQNCGQAIEFEAAQLERSGETPYRVLGQFTDCPHCGKSTQLYMPRHATAAAPKISGDGKVYFSGDATHKNEIGFWGRVGIVAGVMFIVSLIGMIVGYQSGEIPETFFGGVVLGSLFFAFSFVVTGFWIMLPVIVWEKLSQIERNTRK